MPRSADSQKGASLLELLAAVAITIIAVAVSSGFLSATRRTVTTQELTLEASINLRSTLDVLVRDIRLAGACLPVTGDFIALDGSNNGQEDEIWIRTGLVRPDMSCVRTTTTAAITRTTNTIPVESVDGFTVGTRVYIRAPTGAGESFDVTGVDSTNNRLLKTVTLSTDYVSGSGVYAIDERRYFIHHWAAPWGNTPELMFQVGSGTPQPFAVGVERLDFQYQLRRNCPPCDVVTLPESEDEWRLVEQVLVTVRTRSDRQTPAGQFATRTASINIKPRNLLPP